MSNLCIDMPGVAYVMYAYTCVRARVRMLRMQNLELSLVNYPRNCYFRMLKFNCYSYSSKMFVNISNKCIYLNMCIKICIKCAF